MLALASLSLTINWITIKRLLTVYYPYGDVVKISTDDPHYFMDCALSERPIPAQHMPYYQKSDHYDELCLQ